MNFDELAQTRADLRAERDESDRLRNVIATLRAYIKAPEGDGQLRYTEALALADENS